MPATGILPGGDRRLTAIDAARGTVMVLMALDHVRDFIHRGAMVGSPTDLATTHVALFLTRWVTHFCAPMFVFTAGLGAYFWWQRDRSRAQLAAFLASRGAWLVALELTVMQLAYNFSVSASYPVFLLVLWVLGLCMIGLAALVWMPTQALMVMALATIALHNLLDSINAAAFGSRSGLWNLLHQPGAFRVSGLTFIVGYPLVPWVAVMALGFASGPILRRAPADRQRALIWMGAVATVGFLVLRAINGYGDPAPWTTQSSATFTVLSFLNTSKYPPSLLFLLITIGPALVGIALLDRVRLGASHPLVVLGRAPLFYFVAHFFLAHLAAVLLAWGRYGVTARSFSFRPLPSMGGPAARFPGDFGYDLWVVYAVWVTVVVTLYPACRRVADWKAGRREWWVSFL